ncbi:N-6 DNA methylase [Chloroflexota bacterium]
MQSIKLDSNITLSNNTFKPLSTQGLGQHFTPANICQLMVEYIPLENPQLIIDPAVGQGELLWYTKQKWGNSHVVGFDIDGKLIEYCKSRFGHEGVFECSNILSADIQDIRDTVNKHYTLCSADLVVSNPPFGITEVKTLEKGLANKLSENDLTWPDRNGVRRVRTEIAFFFRNLELIHEDGFIAILLPDSIVSGVKTAPFRRFLINHTRLHSVIALPPASFDSTEARISLFVVQKDINNDSEEDTTRLSISNTATETMQTIIINQRDLILRMDPKYYFAKAHLKDFVNKWKPLGDYLNRCNRGCEFYGTDSSLLSHDGDLDYVHSTDFTAFIMRESRRQRGVSRTVGKDHPHALIHEGDILIARVGRGCVGKCAIVNKMPNGGFASGCVYIINSQKVDRYYLCLFLNTQFVKNYFDAHRRGVCSQYITKADLMALPVFYQKKKSFMSYLKILRVY